MLTWDASTSSSVAGYRIYYGTSPGNYNQTKGSGLSSSNTVYQVSDLPGGSITYYFAVTAVDADGNESSYSNEASKTIP